MKFQQLRQYEQKKIATRVNSVNVMCNGFRRLIWYHSKYMFNFNRSTGKCNVSEQVRVVEFQNSRSKLKQVEAV